MVNKTQADNAIYDGLANILVPAGFKGNRSDSLFTRPTPFGFQQVGFPLIDHHPTFVFSVYVALRFDAIQDVANPLYPLAPPYWAGAVTLHLKPAYFIGRDLRPEVGTLDEIAHAMSDIERLFGEHVCPFFEACSDLATVERLLNHNPRHPPATHAASRAITGVVAAGLCRRPDFSEIVASYRAMLGGSIGSIREQFEAAVAHVTANVLPR